MIPKRTTLILGAGASVPYGFPTGEDLVNDIVSMLDIKVWNTVSGKLEPLHNLRDYPRRTQFTSEDQSIFYFCDNIRQFRPPNIDYYLTRNPALAEIGKKIIAYIIKKREHNYFGDIMPDIAGNKSAGWYPTLFDQFIRGITPENIENFDNRPFSVITFNYDVSFDYFFAKSLLNDQTIKEHAQRIFDNIPIIHMYGQVGNVEIKDGRVAYEYGSYKTHYNKMEIKGQFVGETWDESKHCSLSIIGEKKADSKDVQEKSKQAKEILRNSERVVVLGFACDVNNCDLLKSGNWADNKEIYVSNMSKSLAQTKRAIRWIGRKDLLKEMPCDAHTALIEHVDLTQ